MSTVERRKEKTVGFPRWKMFGEIIPVETGIAKVVSDSKWSIELLRVSQYQAVSEKFEQPSSFPRCDVSADRG